MNRKIALVLVLVAVAAAWLYMYPPQIAEPPSAVVVEFKNPNPQAVPIVPDNPAYIGGDIIEVTIEIDVPRAVVPGTRYYVHEEFFNLWDDEVYDEREWELDPFDYPSGKIVLERQYDTAGLKQTEEYLAEYAVFVLITGSGGNEVLRAVAGLDVIDVE